MLSLSSANPSPQLATTIERFFITTGQIPDGQRFENTNLPSIMQSIVINFTGTRPKIISPVGEREVSNDLILGQHTKRFTSVLEGKLDFIGVHFGPTGLHRLLQKPMRNFADSIHPLEENISWYQPMRSALNKSSTPEERITILEQFIAENLSPATEVIKTIDTAATLIRNSNGAQSLEEIGRKIGMSERTMQRYFVQFIGVSPKVFARIARFNAVTKMIEQETASWNDILAEAGYFDFAHFAHDFKSITGQTPSAYYKGKTYYEKFFYGT
jgi:methylphosphotriester-DNA--protein-cysteine methyltransferase